MSVEAASAPRARTNILIVCLVWLAGLGAAAQFGKIAVVIDMFAEIYPVSPVGLGFLVSSVGLCGLIFGVAGGVIVDRIGLRRSLVGGLVLGGALSLIQALSPPFPVMMASRLFEGVAHLAIVVAGPVLMSAHATDQARSAVMTLWSTFFGVAYMLVAVIAARVVASVGVEGLVAGHGVYLLTMAFILWRVMPSPVLRPRAKMLSLADWVAVHRRIYHSPRIAAPGLGFVWYTMMYISLLAFLPGFVGEAARAPLAGAMPLASIVVTLSFGILAVRAFGSVPTVQLGFVATACALVPLIASLGNDSAFVLAAVVMMALTGGIPAGSFAALTDLNENLTNRAHATGALAQMGNVGTTSGPPILAILVSSFGFHGLIGFVVTLCVIGVLIHVWLASRRRYSKEG